MDAVKDLLSKLWDTLWRKTVFLVGDIRSMSSFPWVTWAVRKHEVSFDELEEAMPLIKPGMIGLHRDNGYLSNVAIPGCFKHAWVHIEDNQIVEAISDGVVKRNAMYPMYSDLTIILEPIDKNHELTSERAKSLIGENYDVDFDFDLKRAEDYYKSGSKTNYDPAFSCTEVAAYSLMDDSWGGSIPRSKAIGGKEVIIADSFINESFKIVWASKSVTLDRVMELGLPPAGTRMVSDFLDN